MKKLLIIFAVLVLTSCEKLTFKEYYDCEQALKERTASATADLKAKKITASAYAKIIETAQADYEQCLKDNGGK